MMKILYIPILLVLYQGTNGRHEHQTIKARSDEQSIFGADTKTVDKPVQVPVAALEALRSALKASPDDLPAESLLASVIHLDGSTEVDLVVIGRGASHAVLFWIIQKTADGYRLILNTGGDSLKVLHTRSKGYRDIQVEGFTARASTTATYRFDGHEYVKAREKTRPIE